MKQIDLIIIGGGSAGMSAALAAKKQGCESMLVLERSDALGGILQQCIHNGFGLQLFHEELSGPAFAQRLIDALHQAQIPYRTKASVLSITPDRIVTYVHPEDGLCRIRSKAIILASGCYERTRGMISIGGKRIKGVYTAGSAQRYLNMENILVGRRVFILGSGDIGLIMARRMRLEGAEVLGVAELMPYSNGLTRNIVQCLEDFDIPLYLSHTVIDIQGDTRVEGITIAQVDENKQPIPGSEKHFAADTLLLSVGLIPEETLLQEAGVVLDPKTKGAKVNAHMETSIPHVYACGNALHVHDLVDDVCMEARVAGASAIKDMEKKTEEACTEVIAEGEISYVVPQHITTHEKEDVIFSFRVKRPLHHALITFENKTGVFQQIRKKVLLPSQMQRILCKKEALDGHGAIWVKVREE